MSPTANWIIVLWMALIGGVIGSFLNVVVYRLPLGISIVHPPSHCPRCGKPIRWFDNVPVFGWIVLRGRCRQCGISISPRYPIVEAVTAGTFALLFAVEFVSDGANLPHRAFPAGDVLIREWSLGNAYGICLYHLLLLCTLLCAALIEYDGKRAPPALFWPALAVGLAAPLAWPWLRPVEAWTALPTWAAGTVDGLAGLAAGALAGGIGLWTWNKTAQRDEASRKKKPSKRAASSQSPAKKRGQPPFVRSTLRAVTANGDCPLFFALICVGAFLGWQAALAVAVVTAVVQGLVQLVTRLAARASAPALVGPTIILSLTTLVWILFWASVVSMLHQP